VQVPDRRHGRSAASWRDWAVSARTSSDCDSDPSLIDEQNSEEVTSSIDTCSDDRSSNVADSGSTRSEVRTQSFAHV
jgi:hypothetical protein